MPYLPIALLAVLGALAVTGVMGFWFFAVPAAILVAVAFALWAGARNSGQAGQVVSRREPTGAVRASTDAETTNEKVGQVA